MAKALKLVGFLALLGVVAVVSNNSDTKKTEAGIGSQTTFSASGLSLAGRARELMPQEERDFIATVEKWRNAYRAGQNDMVKGGTRPARAKEICRIMASTKAQKWVGEVDRLSSNNDGKGVLSIKLENDIYVKTWNNAVSDSSFQTLLDPEGGLFAKASSLTRKQPVVFSGSFFSSENDCIRESSLTISGSMTEPDFIFRFSDIEPVKFQE